jgi:cadmium resistance protein CadD (predicted permease)
MAQRENSSTADGSPDSTKVVSAGAFDVRSIIGGLLGLYGIILTIAGLWFTDAQEKSKVDGENLNLMVGVGLLVFAAVFIGWVILRPLKVPVEED